MSLPSRLALVLGLFFSLSQLAQGQSSAQAVGTGTITGHITVGGKPVQGVTVVLRPLSEGPERKAVGRATTDSEGRFQITGVAAGRYQLMPLAPALVSPVGRIGFREQGKSVSLAEGETVEDIDFALVRGGVITGRVTDSDGRPIINEGVRLAPAEQPNNRREPFFFNPFMFRTDDRGIYRIYGIPPGRYLVSIGEESRGGVVRMGFGRRGFYTRTFHPSATDEAKATIIEVTEGSEATGVDITAGRQSQTYSASGQVVDADTGKAVPNVTIGYGALVDGERRMNAFGIGERTDAEGHFRLQGVLPGRYAAFASPDSQNGFYSVPVPFEISEGDVSGLVIKVRPGASISGIVVIEGTSERSVLARLSQLRVAYWPVGETLSTPNFGEGERVNPDGTFRIGGLRPGKFKLMLGGWPRPKGFSLLRIEREGIEIRSGMVEVPAGGAITGLRLVIEYGSGVVRGEVRIENGRLPEGSRLFVSMRRNGATDAGGMGAEVDARGRFVIEGLPAGEYLLRLGGDLGPGGQRLPPVSQNVIVNNGVETEVTLVLDLNARAKANRP